LYHYLATAEDNNGVRALIGNEFGVADCDRFGCGVNGLGRKLFGNVQVASSGGARSARDTARVGISDSCRGRPERLRWRWTGPSFCSARSGHTSLGQRLHQHWQNVAGRNISQWPGHRFSKLNIGVKLMNQSADER